MASRRFGQEEERERPWHTSGLPHPQTIPAPCQVTRPRGELGHLQSGAALRGGQPSNPFLFLARDEPGRETALKTPRGHQPVLSGPAGGIPGAQHTSPLGCGEGKPPLSLFILIIIHCCNHGSAALTGCWAACLSPADIPGRRAWSIPVTPAINSSKRRGAARALYFL